MTVIGFTEELSVCKVRDASEIDFSRKFCFACKAAEELSLVCLTDSVPENAVCREDGWKIFGIEGVLDFSLIGVLSKITSILSENGIGVFAVSTYNTDYILTKKENYEKSLRCLEKAGYTIRSAE
jgi:hypothetical protein